MKVLVIGENGTDIFEYGDVEKICPEAPVPVFQPTGQVIRGGMARNVYNNLISLRPNWDVHFLSQKKSIVKKRLVDKASNQILIRVDVGDAIPESEAISDDQIFKVSKEKWDAIIISDYNKGAISEELILFLSSVVKCPVFMDTKKTIDAWALSVDYIKINEKEFRDNLKHSSFFFEEGNFHFDNLIVTLGSKGAKLLKGGSVETFPTDPCSFLDVSGAGDSFMSGFVVKQLEEKNIRNSIRYANKCAGAAVQRKGIVSVKEEWL